MFNLLDGDLFGLQEKKEQEFKLLAGVLQQFLEQLFV